MSKITKEEIALYNSYKENYFNGTPLISDIEFDEFEQSLVDRGFEPKIGFDDINETDKVVNRKKMLSLEKYQLSEPFITNEMASEIISKYGCGELSWKYDGMAGNVQYTNGELTAISSRGDGEVGRNILPKLKHLFPQTINDKLTVDIRFEIVMSNDNFLKYETEYTHPRNLVAGIVRDETLDDKRVDDLSFAFFEAIDEDDTFVPLKLVHEFFEKNKKKSIQVNGVSDLISVVDIFEKTRDTFIYPTDGMVYTNHNTTFEHNGKYPTNAVAIKFKPPILESEITSFEWILHKTGNYAVKIYFKPIIVDGREIKKASGYNIEYLVENDFKVGSKVRIVLSNDIIPMVKKLD